MTRSRHRACRSALPAIAAAAATFGVGPALAQSTPPERLPDICTANVPAPNLSDPAVPRNVRLYGTQLVFGPDNARQIVKGYNLRAFITSSHRAYELGPLAPEPEPGVETDKPFYTQSYNAGFLVGPNEFAALKARKANAIRLQVSQYYIQSNASNPTEHADYRKCVLNTVRLARSKGFVVILAMQWQKSPTLNASGQSIPGKLPTSFTRSAWTAVDSLFANDDGIVYELYNEPFPALYADNDKGQLKTGLGALWKEWATGSTSAGTIGHQPLIDHLRDTLGSTKVLLAGGLNLGDSFEGYMPRTGTGRGNNELKDRLNRLVYSVHPYSRNFSYGNPDDPRFASKGEFDLYDDRWGYLLKVKGLPVIVTEWNQGASDRLDVPSAPILSDNKPVFLKRPDRLMRSMINYVNNSYISIIPSAFDVNGVVSKDLTVDTTTGDNEQVVWRATNFDRFINWLENPPAGVDVSNDQDYLGTFRGSNLPGVLVCRFFQNAYNSSISYDNSYSKSDPRASDPVDSICLD